MVVVMELVAGIELVAMIAGNKLFAKVELVVGFGMAKGVGLLVNFEL